jgi:hypothetical protein
MEDSDSGPQPRRDCRASYGIGSKDRTAFEKATGGKHVDK